MAGFIVLALLAAAISYIGITSSRSVHAAYSGLKDETMPVIDSLEKLKDKGNNIYLYTHQIIGSYGINESWTAHEKLKQAVSENDDILGTYQVLINSYFQDETLESEDIKRTNGEFINLSNELVELKTGGIGAGNIPDKHEEFEKAYNAYFEVIDRSLEREAVELETRNNVLDSTISWFNNSILFMGSLTFILAILIGSATSLSISRPLMKLKDAAEEIRGGKLDTRIDITSSDETGILADAFNRMVSQLTHEINEHRLTVEKLSRKNEFVKTVLESLSHPFYVINADDYTIALANSAVVPDGLEDGITCYALTHKAEKPCGPGEHRCPLDEVRRTGKPVIVEHLHYNKAGNLRNMEIHCYPIFDDKGKVVQVIEYSLDITERKLAEKMLEESEERFRTLVDNAVDGIVMAETETKKQYIANKMMCRMLGYSLEEFKNLSVMDIHPEQDVPWVMELFEKQAKGEVTLIMDIPIKRKDGSVFYADINATPLKISGKTYNIGIFRDVTERRRNEEIRRQNERLVLANKAKSEFLAVMSHELRTPLNAIIGFSDLLIKKDAGELNEKQQRYASNVITSGKHLLSIIDDILDLTRIESGKMEIIAGKMSVPDAINESIDMINENAKNQNITIKKQISSDIEFIDTDERKFQQILNNLLSNAVKFSKPEGGTITITAEKDADMAKFSVSDTGIGIKDEDLGRLFHSFEQLDAGISRKFGGTGLGLAVSKKLLELLGGRITAQSRYGEGSTFTFYLPPGVKKVI